MPDRPFFHGVTEQLTRTTSRACDRSFSPELRLMNNRPLSPLPRATGPRKSYDGRRPMRPRRTSLINENGR